MYELGIIFTILGIGLILFCGLLFYKKGKFIKSIIGIFSISAFILLITFMAYTSFSSNFYWKIKISKFLD